MDMRGGGILADPGDVDNDRRISITNLFRLNGVLRDQATDALVGQ